MTDDQIRAYADHIEQAASDPNMMREVERMGKLPVEDRQQLQRLQEGLSGAAPMDDQWVTTAVEVIRSKPQLLKTMLKGKGQLLGVTDDKMDGFIDYVSSFQPATLRTLITSLRALGSLSQPLQQAYKTVDAYTLGCARYLLMLLAALLAYLLGLAGWWLCKGLLGVGYALFRAVTGGPVLTSAPTPLTQVAPVAPSPSPSSTGITPGANLGSGAVPAAPKDSADAEFEF
eukprot:CAMPEP_0170115606 /NCGR_PEP_ID=MMETSP0020_2-20130122/11621_1 /TAXON_ID=98059 /ORGANISM="Dinobryon sp., Strain UTEXLB2267" /LENGTH=229 /DNA_ID=CAMNT_0010343259 /DNA_START=569 /DNA_END=1258 /DNA_ORIENTATION=+